MNSINLNIKEWKNNNKLDSVQCFIGQKPLRLWTEHKHEHRHFALCLKTPKFDMAGNNYDDDDDDECYGIRQ